MKRRTDNWFKWLCIGFVAGGSFVWFVLQELPRLTEI